MRPPRWWFHRHSANHSGKLSGGDFFERCICDAGRFEGRRWFRMYPWPTRQQVQSAAELDQQIDDTLKRMANG